MKTNAEAWQLLHEIEKGWDNGFGCAEADLITLALKRAEDRGSKKQAEISAEFYEGRTKGKPRGKYNKPKGQNYNQYNETDTQEMGGK